MHELKTYVMIENIEHDTFYDIAHIRVGVVEDDGVLLSIPVSKDLNDEWIDRLITESISGLVDYITIQAARLYEDKTK